MLATRSLVLLLAMSLSGAACALEPSRDWQDKPEPGEAEHFAEFARIINAQQQEAATANGSLQRGFHAKIQAGLKAEFRVLDNLPAAARFGVFAHPAVFPAYVRFSNGSPTMTPDSRPDPRGIAVKLVGVPGKKLGEGEEDALTQDFLATSHSITSCVRNVYQFFAFIRCSKNLATLPFKLAREVGIIESARILQAFATTVVLPRVNSLATEQFSGTAPVQIGPYAMKFTIRPSKDTARAAWRKRTATYLHEELADRLRAGDLVLDFVLQFFVKEKHTPIEDTSVVWKEYYSPTVKVAEIRIPRTDIDSSAGKALTAYVNSLAFNPWHTLPEHKPLGNIMRARRVAYRESSKLRGHVAEPTSVGK
jgi:hypothetical protein